MAALTVTTNSFHITQRPQRTYFHYDVVISDQAKPSREIPSRQAHEIIQQMQMDNAAIFKARVVYDGRANLFIAEAIPSGDYPAHFGRKPERGNYVVRLTGTASINPRDLDRLTERGGNMPHNSTMAITLLQLIVRQDANLRYHSPPHARSFYLPKGSKPLTGGLEAWHGFFQSVRPVIGRLLINVDTSTVAMYSSGQLTGIALSYFGKKSIRDIERLSSHELKTLEHFLRNVTIEVNIPHQPVRRLRISALVPQGGEFVFEKDGVSMAVKTYFLQHHNLRLQYPHLFGVRIGKTAIFPAEVCVVVPGQLYRRKLLPRQQAVFVRFATRKPSDRLDAITTATGGEALQYNQAQTLAEAGMRVSLQPIEVTGKVLSPPQIQYSEDTAIVTIAPRAGSWNLVGRKFQAPRRIAAWAAVVFAQAPTNAVQDFVWRMKNSLEQLGIVFGHSGLHIEYSDGRNVEWALTHASDEAAKMAPQEANAKKAVFLLVLLPSEAAHIRSQVKYFADTVAGVPTQCVRSGKFEMAKDDYFKNVALKINAKTGGINSTIVSQVNQWLESAMVVGADVSHPGPGITNRPSIASLVASMAGNMSVFSSQVRLQQPRQEIIGDLHSMLHAALTDFWGYQSRSRLPLNMVFYRDGVSEGEYSRVCTEEIRCIEEALLEFMQEKNLGPKSKPKLTFIVVGKRHHIRFFPINQHDADRSGNCPPGFVVSNDVTNADLFDAQYKDFYLQSHSGIQGTSRPSHYIVLKNESGLSVSQLQELSYMLCHVYASATRSVSIPAPVYYADRICARAGFQFKPDHDLRLEEDTVTTTDNSQPFDLAKWQKAFTESALRRRLYFL